MFSSFFEVLKLMKALDLSRTVMDVNVSLVFVDLAFSRWQNSEEF